MSLEIAFSIEATDTLVSITTFIKNKWGDSASKRFRKRVDKVLITISNQPHIFKA